MGAGRHSAHTPICNMLQRLERNTLQLNAFDVLQGYTHRPASGAGLSTADSSHGDTGLVLPQEGPEVTRTTRSCSRRIRPSPQGNQTDPSRLAPPERRWRQLPSPPRSSDLLLLLESGLEVEGHSTSSADCSKPEKGGTLSVGHLPPPGVLKPCRMRRPQYTFY